jgi:uncharacterized protein (TIGR03437 family)
MVADTGNKRIEIFNAAASINSNNTAPITVTSGLNTPVSITSNASGFWVADVGLNDLLHFPAVSQLGLKNSASDASQPALQPFSGFVDTYGNLLVADNANRIVYFAPQVSVVSSASYSTRALTAGMIASVFPATQGSTSSTATPSVIAAGTGNFTALPLPTVLGDTQVLVNNTPAPLFFVSPGQINMVLPNELPTGGTANLAAVRQSTGQIYGSAELQLASADPAMFTMNQAGTGQIAAINFVDGTVNSPSNPVARGQVIELYGTGVGPIPGAPPDGQASSDAVLAPTLPQIVLGTSTTFLPSSNILYSGLAPGLVGVWQINLMIPTTAPTGGSVAVRMFQDSIPSIDPSISQGSTAIAIK